MLRVLSERRAWVVAALVALTIVTGLWVWGLPHATARAAHVLGDRLGMVADIEDARFSVGGLELRGVEMRGQHGGVVARIDRVNADVSLLAAIFKGAAAVRRVAAHGIELDVDLRNEGAADSITAVREKLVLRGDANVSPENDSPRRQGRAYED